MLLMNDYIECLHLPPARLARRRSRAVIAADH
jgi:hypothetical protein